MSVFTIDLDIRGHQHKIRYNLDAAVNNESVILRFLTSGDLYEPDISTLMLRVVENGDTVIDVGANIGFFAVLAGHLVGEKGTVKAYEPDVSNQDRLSANLVLNGLFNVEVYSEPVSNSVGPVTFYINSDSNGGNTLWDPGNFPDNELSRANPKPIEMQSTTLDVETLKIASEKIKLIKIDTEGCEQLVLEGAKNLLNGAKVPFVIAELHEWGLEELGHSQMSLRTYMAGLGYQTFALSGTGEMPIMVPPKTRITSDHYINILFSTPEHISRYWNTYKPRPIVE